VVIRTGLVWLRTGTGEFGIERSGSRVPGYRSKGPGTIPDFPRSNGSETVFTQPSQYN
jgi:hypothetical protein